jgi:ABC-type nitrate/sulfonate/bicarbonate transport system permease component
VAGSLTNLQRRWLPLLGPVGLLVFWQLLASSGAVNQRLLPTPVAVFRRAYELIASGPLLWDIATTLSRCFLGYFLALAIGIPIGFAIGLSSIASAGASIILDFFRSLPVTAAFPIFLILFGVGSESMIAMVFFATVFIVIMHAKYGIQSIPAARRRMAQSFGATELQILVQIRAVEALAHVLIGARTVLSLALIVAIVSEMFIGSTSGLGQRLFLSYQMQTMNDLYAIVVVVGAIGYVLNLALLAFERSVSFD